MTWPVKRRKKTIRSQVTNPLAGRKSAGTKSEHVHPQQYLAVCFLIAFLIINEWMSELAGLSTPPPLDFFDHFAPPSSWSNYKLIVHRLISYSLLTCQVGFAFFFVLVFLFNALISFAVRYPHPPPTDPMAIHPFLSFSLDSTLLPPLLLILLLLPPSPLMDTDSFFMVRLFLRSFVSLVPNSFYLSLSSLSFYYYYSLPLSLYMLGD